MPQGSLACGFGEGRGEDEKAGVVRVWVDMQVWEYERSPRLKAEACLMFLRWADYCIAWHDSGWVN